MDQSVPRTVIRKNVISKTTAKKLRANLRHATEEKQVEPVYHDFLTRVLPPDFRIETNVGGLKTDGYIRSVDMNLFGGDEHALVILLETKYGIDLDQTFVRAQVVAQAIYYTHHIAAQGHPKPVIFFCGDEDQMFLLYAAHFDPYLEGNPGDPQWALSPSAAAVSNTPLVKALTSDPSLDTVVYNVNDADFDFNDVAARMMDLHGNGGKLTKIEVTEQNVRALLDRFERTTNLSRLLGGKGQARINDDEWARYKVSIFTNAITGHPDQALLGAERLRTASGDIVSITGSGWARFFDTYAKVTDEDTKNLFRSISESLVPEVARRLSGDYWTRTEWTDRAHGALTDAFGEDWRARYRVWDPAWGTGNLTRDYTFGKLYASTLFQSELDIATHINDNDQTTKFQYDFLNDDPELAPGGQITPNGRVLKPEYVVGAADTPDEADAKRDALAQAATSGDDGHLYYKMPADLYQDLSDPDVEFVWLMNPPYGKPGNPEKNATGATATTTAVKDQIKADATYRGGYHTNLYSQFYYRVLKIMDDFSKTGSGIGAFSKSQFLTGGAYWTPLLRMFNDRLTYRSGFLINAGNFAEVKPDWGVLFSVWTPGPHHDVEFPITLETQDTDGPVVFGRHTLREVPAEKQIKNLIPVGRGRGAGYQKHNGVITPTDWPRGAGAIGSIAFHSQNVEQVRQYTWLDNLKATASLPVTPGTALNAAAVLGFVRSVPHTWWQDKDNFQVPAPEVTATAEYRQFQYDALVLCALEAQNSYRSAPAPGGGTVDVGNEWFWVTHEHVAEVAKATGADGVLRDVRNHKPVTGQRFLATELTRLREQGQLSSDALALLDAATALLDHTMGFREMDVLADPASSFQAWDAGWPQINRLIAKRVKRTGKDAAYFDQETLDLSHEFKEARAGLLRRFERYVYQWGVLVEPELVVVVPDPE